MAIIYGGARILERHVSLQSSIDTLTGIIALPEQEAPRGAVLFSHGWAGNRNGPANILVNMARNLATKGFVTLRFDFRGRGESSGNGLLTTLDTMAVDLASAAASLRKESGFEAIFIIGMCSGGNVAIGALPQLGNVKCMALLSVYPFSDGDSFGRDLNRSRYFLATYLSKACRLENWKRLLAGEASLLRVFRVIFRPFLKRGENRKKEGALNAHPKEIKHQENVGTLVKAAASESRNNNAPPPVKHLAKLRRDLPVLMIYGTGDPDAAAAQKYFGEFANEKALPVTFLNIRDANHNFSSQSWQSEVINEIISFINNI